MKLFEVTYMDDCEIFNYLTVGENKETVEKRERDKLEKNLSCFMFCKVHEVSEVDGYKVKLEK